MDNHATLHSELLGVIPVNIESIRSDIVGPTKFTCVNDDSFYAYCAQDIKNTKELFNLRKNSIKNVIFNPPATIIFWSDGAKTVVKCQGDDSFDPEKGMAMAIAKRYLGNKYSYYNPIKKWTKKYEKEYRENGRSLCDYIAHIHRLSERIKLTGKFARIESAYNILITALNKKRPRKAELEAAMTEAIGYLGEVLDD